jgi:hypothetical protein
MRNDVRAITAEPQWSTTQQTFLDLLQDVENQPLSKLDLCRKAGFAFAGPWYTAIKDPEFKAAVKALYAEGERHRLPAETQVPQWNQAQQKLLDLLQVEENRQLTIAELCEKAGLPNFGY